ncbi:hypothetical protein [Burkholderia vietnamiensis]|uniref:hypothetical protein n=3 Tax=Burkholderia vietnamiensis TaxID=60552 RepID=UPI00158BE2DB|nr:hypothetical protein [Burkholderia vietnamiensis]
MGAVRHACEKCEQGGSFTSQLHRNERRFDSLSGKFDVVSPETSAVGPLISISLAHTLSEMKNAGRVEALRAGIDKLQHLQADLLGLLPPDQKPD